jgi:hypothetical protein
MLTKLLGHVREEGWPRTHAPNFDGLLRIYDHPHSRSYELCWHDGIALVSWYDF